ncbi:MAG: hypothetical protein KDA21_04705 [Phycisphaerales bacterium]|nr:hypothetical protein [Phycisphaerales bacterium]
MTTRDLETRLDDWGRQELGAIERDMGIAAADPMSRAAGAIARRRLIVRTAAITTVIVLLLTLGAFRAIDAMSDAPPPTPTSPR